MGYKNMAINRLSTNPVRNLERMTIELSPYLNEWELDIVMEFNNTIYTSKFDINPLVAVTTIYSWGFRGINYHWGTYRQYTWEEVIGPVHLVYREELKDLRALPYAKFRLNI